MLGCGPRRREPGSAINNRTGCYVGRCGTSASVPWARLKSHATTTTTAKSSVSLTQLRLIKAIQVPRPKVPLTLVPAAHVTVRLPIPRRNGALRKQDVQGQQCEPRLLRLTLRHASSGSTAAADPSMNKFRERAIGQYPNPICHLVQLLGILPVTYSRRDHRNRIALTTDLPHTLKKGESVTIKVSFTPTTGGTASASIRVSYDPLKARGRVAPACLGNGIRLTQTVSLTPFRPT